ncbi:ketohydroxyglutarate aldolase [Lactobacillus panisapium]|uniref:Ketohydroxyglutarate aldolase n=1 Tax=Lactobacillus panisapium TaxID=2012495 RepID=A0ABX8W7M6_9LACO|nr:ketohydroxyglutarate aldolase [Lactobacillus panisapium]QYN52138.1 ketohydroxyglutarate aldolase [Lactobacillus panisapium]
MLQKNSYVQQISDLNIMAVVRDTPEETLRIAQACLKGGVKAIEVSFTVSTALRSLTKISDELPEMVACAGTVLDAATARLAILSGAKLILSPAFSQEVAEVCNLYQVPYAPGCNSMTEITTALRAGASFIKVFPGSALGGTKEITTIKTPIPFMPLLVSGGATLANYRDFLLAGADCVSFGSALTGDSEKITKNALLLNKTLSNFRIDKR